MHAGFEVGSVRTLIFVLIGVLVANAIPGYAAPLAPSPGPMPTACVYTVTQGAFFRTVQPVEGAQTVTTFYDYYSASAHTPFVEAYASVLFLYRATGSGTLYLVFHFNIDDGGSPDAETTVGLTGVPGGAGAVLSDDPGQGGGAEFFMGRFPQGQFHYFLNTDGGVLGPLPTTTAWSVSADVNHFGPDPMRSQKWVDGSTARLALAMTETIVIASTCNRAPTANAGGPYAGPEGSPITLSANGSTDPDGDALQYRWDFQADGTWDTGWSSAPDVAYTWGDDWSGKVRVEVSDGQVTATAESVVTVHNAAPAIALTVIPSGNEADALSLQVEVREPGSDDLTVAWTGDCTGWSAPTTYLNDPGLGPDPDPSPDVNPRDITDAQTVVCGDNGAFAWSLAASDDDGAVTTAGGTLTVGNLPPRFTVSPPESGATDEGTQVSVSATATDPGSDDLTFTWTWELGPTETRTYFNDGVGPDPGNSPGGTYPFTAADASAFTYGDNGVFTLSIMLMDDDGGLLTFTTGITVTNVPPTPSIDRASQVQTPPLPAGEFYPLDPIVFDGSATDAGSDDLTFTWDFGDGTVLASPPHYNDGVSPDPYLSPGGTFPFAAGEGVSHAYAPGDYTVTLTVTDDDGGSGTATMDIHVTSAMDLKHEAIKRIKALKELALARGDEKFLHELDEAEEHVWKSLGYKHPFRPDTVTADPAADVTVRTRSHDKVELTLGPSWASKLDAYTTLRLTWANGVVTVIDLPSKWPDKHGELRARPWVDAWHLDVRVHTEKEKKSGEVALDVHAHEASLGFTISLDGDRVADLSFTYKMRHLWVDSIHLDPKHGKKVFDEERKAVKELVCIVGKEHEHDDEDGAPGAGILGKDDDHEHKRCHEEDEEHGGPPPSVVCRGLDTRKWTAAEIATLDAECDAIANLLVKADEILALVALQDAKNTPIQNPKNAKHVQHEIEKAEKELKKAYEEWLELDYRDAIKHFGKAWKHAQHAIRDANKS